MRRSVQAGFTLVEVLVVIGIVGVLMALLFPAVQAARETARRMHCANNLKQVSLAMHAYHDTHGKLPVGAYGCCWGTWMVALLPHLELKALYDRYDHGGKYDLPPGSRYDWPRNIEVTRTRIPVFTCSSNNAVIHTERHGVTAHNYVVNMGNTGFAPNTKYGTKPVATLGGARFAGAPFLIGGEPRVAAPAFSLAHLADGLSNTLMLSETIQGEGKDLRGLVWWGYGAHFETNLVPNASQPDVLQLEKYCDNANNPRHPCVGYAEGRPITAAARSWHPGGVQAALCDGAVRFVSDSVELATWRALGTTSGGEPPGEF